MAIDTEAKRRSALNFHTNRRTMPVPTGAVSRPDKRHLLWGYIAPLEDLIAAHCYELDDTTDMTAPATTGDPQFTTPGLFAGSDKKLVLDGNDGIKDNSFRLGASPALTVATVSLWVKVDALGADQHLIYAQGGSNTPFQIYVNSTGKIVSTVADGAGNSVDNTTDDVVITAGQTHFVVVDWDLDNQIARIFVDGDEKATTITSTPWATLIYTDSQIDTGVGFAHIFGGLNFLTGQMDRTCFFHGILSDEQMAALYIQTVGGPYCVAAQGYYFPGVTAGGAYQPGAAADGVYQPGATASQTCN